MGQPERHDATNRCACDHIKHTVAGHIELLLNGCQHQGGEVAAEPATGET